MTHRSYLLELDSPENLRPKEFPRPGISMLEAAPREIARCRRLWTGVGKGFWSERGNWPDARWDRHLKDPSVSFWIAAEVLDDIGFFELSIDADEAKIEGFGLLPTCRGQGVGGGLLTVAARKAFDLGARRVWLHTATDDHPNALPNYLKRGFRIYHEEALENPMPDAAW